MEYGMPVSLLVFPPFILDPTAARLWRGKKRIALSPKDYALLHYLVTHAGQVISQAELLQAVWSGETVSPETLKVRVGRVRALLGDKAAKPRFIENVHGKGYRFLPAVATRPAPSAKRQTPSAFLVGREAELAQLCDWLEKARHGERQLVFVTGEPGIGKTALIEAFLSRAVPPATLHPAGVSFLSSLTPTLVGWGQCIEQYGPGEPYMPVLEALGRLGRTANGQHLKTVFAHYAPTWLVQLPALLSAPEQETLQRRVLVATRDRMLREIAEALEVLTSERTLVLVLEDLHWADASTLELLTMLARWRELTRMLVIGTYRSTEMLNKSHPLTSLMHELHAHALCRELALRSLSQEDVVSYLLKRFPHSVFPARLAELLYRRTEGNPLFVVSVIDDLVAQGMIMPLADTWVTQGEEEPLTTVAPKSIRHLVARQRERLRPDEQQVLEAASVAGLEFSVAAVAAALETEVIVVGEHCRRLAERQQFLRPAGIAEWPDGTVAGRYGFMHALYQQLWHERVSIEQQQQWHSRIGKRKEAAYGDRVGELAAELAVHFVQGRDYRRAIRYLQQAGENAMRRSASAEAIALVRQALELLKTLPDTPERTLQELALHMVLGMPLVAAKGYGAPEVGSTYARARALCQQIGDTPRLFPVFLGLCTFYATRGELETGRELAEQFLRLAERVQEPAFLLQAHAVLGNIVLFQGELTLARAHLEQSISLYDSQRHSSQLSLPQGPDPGVFCLSRAAQALWLLGYPAQALQRNQEALTLAKELSQPWLVAWAMEYAALTHQLRGEGQLTQTKAEAVLALASEQGFVPIVADSTILRGWSLAAQGHGEAGIAQLRQGQAILQTIGNELTRTYSLALLAEAYGKAGQDEEGLGTLDEALGLVDNHGERFYEAELYRLKGELLLPQGKGPGARGKVPGAWRPMHRIQEEADAEAYFHKAIDIARRQRAKALELRATTSLARLWRQQGKNQHALAILAKMYRWFSEGFDTKDLQEAKVLLRSLESKPDDGISMGPSGCLQ